MATIQRGSGGMSGYLIGIDPGISGAIVVLQSGACPDPVDWVRMPMLREGRA